MAQRLRPVERRGRLALLAVCGAVVTSALVVRQTASAFAYAGFAGAASDPTVRSPLRPSEQQAPARGDMVAMGAYKILNQYKAAATKYGSKLSLPGYSTRDREAHLRLRIRQRKERHIRNKESPSSCKRRTVNETHVEAAQDIYTRTFTGDGAVDPVGGRYRYDFYVLFKTSSSLAKNRASFLSEHLKGYRYFFEKKMSGRDITFETMNNPANPYESITTLEYPMRAYGMKTKQRRQDQWNQAVLIKMSATLPPTAHQYTYEKLYQDSEVVRMTSVRKTQMFKHRGEDNEMKL